MCKTITSTSPFHTKVKTNPHKTFFLDGTTFKGVDNQVSLTVWTPDSVPVCPFCRVVRTINHNVFVSVVLPINETSQSLVFCVLGILLNSEERSMYRSFCQSCYFWKDRFLNIRKFTRPNCVVDEMSLHKQSNYKNGIQLWRDGDKRGWVMVVGKVCVKVIVAKETKNGSFDRGC